MNKKSVLRFRQIIRTLAYHGFGYIMDTTLKKQNNTPANLRKAFEELGPTFIKIGQILSTRPDILPDIYIEELSKLQDSAQKESYENINKVFFEEFNSSIDETFLTFEKIPLASASISQVHNAILKNGKEVIVKIQRPNIADQMHLDISILYKMVKLTKTRFADSLIDPLEALDELLYATEMELNFENEIKNIEKFNKLNETVAFVTVPKVYHDFCTKKVITLEKINGLKINNLKKLEEEHYDLDDIGKKLALSYFKQIFTDGFFHSDPHPGNLIIKDNKICYIDFGLVGSLSTSLKSSLNDIVVAIAYEDISKLVSVLMTIGIRKGYVNRNKLYEDIDYLLTSYLSASLRNIKISVFLQEIFYTAKTNNIKLPREFTLLIRGLVIVEGVIAKLSPDLQILDIAIPFVKANNRNSFLEDFDFEESLIKLISFTDNTLKLPSKLIELSNSLMQGRAKIQLEHKSLKEPITSINKMMNRLAASMIVSSMIIGSSLVLNSNIGPMVYSVSIIGLTGFLVAAIFGLWLLISIVKSGRL